MQANILMDNLQPRCVQWFKQRLRTVQAEAPGRVRSNITSNGPEGSPPLPVSVQAELTGRVRSNITSNGPEGIPPLPKASSVHRQYSLPCPPSKKRRCRSHSGGKIRSVASAVPPEAVSPPCCPLPSRHERSIVPHHFVADTSMSRRTLATSIVFTKKSSNTMDESRCRKLRALR